MCFADCLFVYGIWKFRGSEKGYGNIKKDSIDEEVQLVYGTIPDWINGILVHHTCGVFGERESDLNIHNKINHIFDCLSIGQSFKFENGRVSFYSRFYDTVQTDIYKSYNMNLSESKVFWRTGFADFDIDAVLKHDSDFEEQVSPTKPKSVPHVTWWNVGNKAYACTEETTGVQIDVHNMTVIGDYPFKDDNFGYDGTYYFINNPAHESWDADGTVWSNTMVFLPNWWTFSAKQWRLIYKVVDDVRIKVAEIPYPDISPWNCEGDKPYADPKARMPYLHSFAASENYLILPENSYVFEPCAIMSYIKNRDVPYYKVGFKFEKDIPSVVRVIRKSDGKQMAAIETTPFFATHQLNAYEENGKIYADMITFDDASLYTDHTWVDSVLEGDGFESHVHRFIINTEDWTMEEVNFFPEPMHLEMSHVRPDYMGFKYKYGYVCDGIYYDKPQHIHKLNWENKEVLTYTFEEDIYPQEPWFIPTPGGTDEDDGVLLVQGFDGNAEKGFLMVIDAKTMKPTAYALASDMILFGFHVKFYPLDTERKPQQLSEG